MTSLATQIGQLSPEQIKQLARAIDQKKRRSPGPALQRHHGRSEYPLSCGQERLWFLDQLVPGNVAYNWPFAFRFRIALDPALFRATLTEITRRHEILRTSYSISDGIPVQRIAPADEVPVRLVDLRGAPQDEAEREAMRL